MAKRTYAESVVNRMRGGDGPVVARLEPGTDGYLSLYADGRLVGLAESATEASRLAAKAGKPIVCQDPKYKRSIATSPACAIVVTAL